jgi:agmatine/peptidylarginine deiminase
MILHKQITKCTTLALLWFLVFASESPAQTGGSGAQATANDVVVLALEALNSGARLRQQVRNGLTSESDATRNVENQLLGIQMNIVKETANFGPVLLLAPDEATRTALEERCKEFQICELLKSDRVRIKVVAHDGVWIRDFGPWIEADGDKAKVVHWRYFDLRTEEAKQEKLQELEAARLKLLEAREQEEQPNALSKEESEDERKAAEARIDDRLYLLREYAEILKEASPQRSNDDSSAYDVADAVLAAPDFAYAASKVALDGGNLFKLEDGRCLTTRVLLSRNKDQDINVDKELEKVGGCKTVTYLEPLPGDVIEHIDMFALPVGGKRILLASYDLSKPFAKEYWSQLSPAERDLAANAELAMEADAEELRRLDYEVIPVTSPFPRIPRNGYTYYPSVLNVLVRTASDGSRKVLIPRYKDYEANIQALAQEEIAEAFGSKTSIVAIEATEAAKSQGAIHCLTLSAPLALSIFGDAREETRRREVLAQKEELDRSAAAEMAAEIPAGGLEGSWVILSEDERQDENSLELYPQRIYFGKNEFEKGVFDQLESKGKYTVDKREGDAWSLRFVFGNQEVMLGLVQWINKDEVKLAFGDGESALVLRRTGAGPGSPFKNEKGGSGQNRQNKGAPTKLETVQP